MHMSIVRKILAFLIFSSLVVSGALVFNLTLFTLINLSSNLLNTNSILNIIISILIIFVSTFATVFIIAFALLFKRMPLSYIMKLIIRLSLASYLFSTMYLVVVPHLTAHHETIEKSFDSFVKSVVFSNIHVESKFPLHRYHEIIVNKVVVLPRNGIFTSDAVTLAEHQSFRDLGLERTCLLCLHGAFDCPLVCEIKEQLKVYPKPIDSQKVLFFERLLLCKENSYKRYFYLKIKGDEPFEVRLIDDFSGVKYSYYSQSNCDFERNHCIDLKKEVKCIPCKYYIIIKNLGQKDAIFRFHSGFEEVCDIIEVTFINPNAIKLALSLPPVIVLLSIFVLYNLRVKRKRRTSHDNEKIELFIEKS